MQGLYEQTKPDSKARSGIGRDRGLRDANWATKEKIHEAVEV